MADNAFWLKCTIGNEKAKASVSDEIGCRALNLYEIATAPNHLRLYEVYDDETAFQQHLNSARYKHFNEVSAPIIASRAGARGNMVVTYRKQLGHDEARGSLMAL